MEITDISITMGATKSLGNYESAKAQVSVTGLVRPEDHLDIGIAFDNLRKVCERELNETMGLTIHNMRGDIVNKLAEEISVKKTLETKTETMKKKMYGKGGAQELEGSLHYRTDEWKTKMRNNEKPNLEWLDINSV